MNFNVVDDIVSLLEFIENKKNKSESVTVNEILSSYLISIKIALINTYTEQEDIELALYCSDLIGNIFIVIYSYSLNLKLSLFICERAILLFNEYMNISNNYNSAPVHISDIKQFIINKSIGPIILKNSNSSITDFIGLFDTMRLFMNKICIMCKDDSINYIEDVLEKIIKTLPISMMNLFLKGHIAYINEELENINSIDEEDMIHLIQKLSIKLEIFLFIYNSNKKNNIDKIRSLTNKAIQHSKISGIMDRGESSGGGTQILIGKILNDLP